MRVNVISATIQEFDGVRYYLCGSYFQKKGIRLHRVVWEFHFGVIPDGNHVHHADGDRANNQIENLQCISYINHLSGEHGAESGIRGKKSIDKARLFASKWHGSEEGRKWHSQHYDKHIRPIMDKTVDAVCQHCGAAYQVNATKVNQGKFCGNNCKARALRKRRSDERKARRVLSDGAK